MEYTQPDGLDSQIGGLFYNLDTQDVLPDFQYPEKDLWQSQTQAHAWDEQETVDVAKAVAEVALEEGPPHGRGGAPDGAGLPFHDTDAAAPAHLSFQDTAAEDAGDDADSTVGKPEFSCAYCGIHKPLTLAQCVATGKWFCNGQVTPGGSCLTQHLVRGRYKEVRLHRDSPLGGAVLECYHSGTRNVFALGFVAVKSENTVVLLARDTPQTAQCVKELDLDLSLWEPVIQDRALVPWLVRQPTAEECSRARKLKAAQMLALEEMWKSDPAASVDSIADVKPQEEPLHVALRYDDAYVYQNVFAPLVAIEGDYDKACREALRKENLRVSWQTGSNKRTIALFHFPRDDEALHVMAGDELVLQHDTAGAGGGPWEGVGIVVQITAAEEVALELRPRKGARLPTGESLGFSAELTWNSTSYERMQAALKTFAEDDSCMSHFLYHKLLGHELDGQTLRRERPPALYAPGLPAPNHSQMAAIETALYQPLTIIQGPPGTGKTVTSATLVWLLCTTSRAKVLVAAPSNVAVDHLAEKVAATGLKVVRLCSRRRESMESSVEHLTLHYQATNLKIPSRQQLAKLQALKEERGELSIDEERRLHQLKRAAEGEILREADVICCTCIGAGDKRLRGMRFEQVLIDESTQAMEPECLIPLVLGAKQAVFVGDHCQLGPVIMNKLAARCGLSQSLVERMILCGIRPIRLQVQYRMHPCLSQFPSNTFYEGDLQNGVTEAERVHPHVRFPWPDAAHRYMFYQQHGVEEISSSGTSYVNRQEASTVEKVVTCFLSFGVKPEQLGVITPYEGQRAQIVRVMEQLGPLSKKLYSAIEVASVDSFQGREKDYVVFSCVRSSELQGIGFLSDPRRLNVALTRARFGLVILGNARVLSKQALWNLLLVHFKDRGVLVEGPLTALRPSLVPFGKPERRFDTRAFTLGSRFSSRYKPTEHVEAPGAERQAPPGAPTPRPPTHPPPPRTRQQLSQLGGANPYSLAPIPGAMLTQEAFTSQGGVGGSMSQQFMSLGDMLGSFSLGGGGGGAPFAGAPSQGYLDAALPEFRGLMDYTHVNSGGNKRS